MDRIAAISGNAFALEQLCYQLAKTIGEKPGAGNAHRSMTESRLRHVAKLSEMEREILGSAFPRVKQDDDDAKQATQEQAEDESYREGLRRAARFVEEHKQFSGEALAIALRRLAENDE
jgi:hypothetical protein